MADGKAGAPLGNTNSAVGRQGRRALEVALHHYDSGKKLEDVEVASTIRTLVRMWWPIITKAMEHGDLAALKEINDRLDGRSAQSIDISAKVDLGLQDMTDSDLDRRLKQLEQANEQSTKD